MKKILSAALALVFTLTIIPAVPAGAAETVNYMGITISNVTASEDGLVSYDGIPEHVDTGGARFEFSKTFYCTAPATLEMRGSFNLLKWGEDWRGENWVGMRDPETGEKYERRVTLREEGTYQLRLPYNEFNLDLGYYEGFYFPIYIVVSVPDSERPQTPILNGASPWASLGISSAHAKGFVPVDILSSYTDTITRLEFCRMAVRWVSYALGKPLNVILAEKGLTRDENAFTDTSDPDILAAYALGVTSGVGNNRFNPQGTFDRQQSATMIMNTMRAIGADISNPPPSGFEDLTLAAEWARPGINYARSRGIMNGTSTEPPLFSPLSPYSREQAIVTFDNITLEDSSENSPESLLDPVVDIQDKLAAGEAPEVIIAEFEREIVRLLNAERAKVGMRPLEWDDRLGRASRLHSEDMLKRDYHSHFSPEGTDPTDRARKEGWPGEAGENLCTLGGGQHTAQRAFDSWMRSGGHRVNMLHNAMWSHIGIGLAYDPVEGVSRWTMKLARYEPRSITPRPEGNGTAAADKYRAIDGETVKLTATPEEGYAFDRWEVKNGKVVIDNPNSPNASFVMVFFPLIDALTVIAHFKPIQSAVTVSVNNPSYGTAAADKASPGTGERVTLTAAPAEGYEFERWELVSGGYTGQLPLNATFDFLMPPGDVSFRAHFRRNQHLIYAEVYPMFSGTAAADKPRAGLGDTVNLTATPAEGFAFDRWLVMSGSVTLIDAHLPDASFVMTDSGVTVRAVFVLAGKVEDTRAVIVNLNDPSAGRASAQPGRAAAGNTVSLLATANNGYVFERWEVVSGGVTVVNAASPSAYFIMPDEDVLVTAVFRAAE